MKRFLIYSLLFLMSFGFAQAQDKNPISHESMWMMKRVGAPEVSPDGQWVVFSVQEPAYDEKEVVNDLWLAPADGSAKPRKITSGKAGESGYQWSPDSKTIAFVARRDGEETSQIYLLNVKNGGEAQRFTNISSGAGSPNWSPDGKSILFSSSVYPGAFTEALSKKIADEKKKIKYKARVYTGFPVRNFDRWIDEKQTHLFVQSLDGGSASNVFAGLSMVNQSGFQLGGYTWTPDSKGLVFSATTEANQQAYQETPSQLYQLAFDGSDAKMILSDPKNTYGSPAFSPDGKSLFCTENPRGTYKVYDLSKMVRFDWPSVKNKSYIAANLDRPVNNFTVKASGIFMSVEDQGHDKIYQYTFANKQLSLLSKNKKGCYNSVSVSDDGKVVLALYDDANAPAEVVRLNTSSVKAISQFNQAELNKLDMPEVEEFWFTSARGKQIHSFIVRPAGFDPNKKYPLFVVMHGGPASAYKDNWGYRWNYHLLAKPGYVLVLTNYTGSTGFGEKFAQDIQYDPFKGPGDEINEAAAYAIKNYSFIDASKQAIGGASYGGHLANWMQATTTHYKCMIAHAGLVNSEVQWGTSDGIYGREIMNGGLPWEKTKTFTEQNPIRYAANFKTPMLITIGERDFRVPINNSLENYSALQRLKVPAKLVVFPDENHWILNAENSRFHYQQMQEWLATYLK